MGGVAGSGLPAISFVEETGSTNDDIRELGRGDAPHGSAEAARRQVSGRGCRGHVWRSPEGGLYLSVLLRPSVPMRYLVGLPAVCALGVLGALRGSGAADVALKWPNDVVVGGAKLAGVLVEAGCGDAGQFCVCGVGVNLRRGAGPSPDAAVPDGSVRPLPVAYLEERLAGRDVPALEDVAVRVRDGIVGRVDSWAADVAAGRAAAGPLAPVLSEYFDAVPLLGRQVEAVLPDGRTCLRGTFAGVDAWGRATVRLSDGRDVEVASEQASLREA